MFEFNYFNDRFHLLKSIPENDEIIAVRVHRAYGRDGIDEFGCTYRIFSWKRSERNDLEIIPLNVYENRYQNVVDNEGEDEAAQWALTCNLTYPGDPENEGAAKALEIGTEMINALKSMMSLGLFTVRIG